jgi:hypothetical protein
MDNNGNGKPPLTFAAPKPQIPIIGQPFKLEGWMVQIFLTCKCEAGSLVVIIGQPGTAAGRCAGCGKVYVLAGVTPSASGELHFSFAVKTSAPAAVPGTGE